MGRVSVGDNLMPSNFQPIATAVAGVLGSLSGAPPVSVRKDDSLFGRENPPLVIVTMGEERAVTAVSGAGTTTDLGDVYKSYEIGITVYRNCLADIDVATNLNPDYILAAKQALNKNTLIGVSAVRDTQLVDHIEWEHQPFGQSFEVSRFGIVFFCWETRLGN